MDEDPTRYFSELQHKFIQLPRVIAYVISFIFLSLHLLHGFQSSFQSVGASTNKSRLKLHKFGNIFAVVIPLGFVFVALFHFLTQSH
jgi:succinate dehydrogenase / fumarate reductase cytochrome b subunit